MASNWEVIKLNDFVNIKTGFPFKSKQYLEHGEGYKLLRGDNVIQGAFRWENVKLWSEDELTEKQKDYFLENGDVILAMDRPWIEAGLKTAQITNRDLPCLLVQRVARLQAKNSEDQDFLRYLISSYWFVEYLKLVQTGTAIPHISTKQILSYETKIPPLEERKKIGSLLRSLDDKIELNLQMNETLEAMAQALFKSWFVNFDPVIDNALAAGNAIPDELIERAEQRKEIEKKDHSDIQDLFPDEFEFTEEMGWIPKGWASGTIAGISFVKGGYAFKSKDFTDTGFPVIKIKNINSDRTVNTSDVQFIPNEIAKKVESFWLKTGDLMMAMTGATVGKFGLLVAENKKAYLLNQRVAKFSPISSVSDKIWFIYCFLNQKSTIDYIVNIAEGSAQPNISADSIMATQLVKPSNELINIFNETVDSNLNKMLMNREECLTLEKLRDTLLPKLISGELRIQDAEALVDEVL